MTYEPINLDLTDAAGDDVQVPKFADLQDLAARVTAAEATVEQHQQDILNQHNANLAQNEDITALEEAVAAVRQVPTGGTEGQVLKRIAGTNAYAWADDEIGGGTSSARFLG